MNEPLHSTLREAMQLIRAGDLMAATAEIQRRLGGAPQAPPAASDSRGNGDAKPPIDGEFRVLAGGPAAEATTASTAPPAEASAAAVRAAPPEVPETDVRNGPRAEASFIEGTFACAAGSRRYKLFVPSIYHGQPLPLVVMLHGCTQAPDDFARGTRMNVLAEKRGCFVLYPAQAQEANASRCWNWFHPAHQGREGGEPAIIAGLVRELAATYGLDRERIYVAGMSAGGAMAVVLGQTHPELFAAVGVHSGIPYRAAHDMPSAFAAMHGRAAGVGSVAAPDLGTTTAVPTIVFHGDRDTTVKPGNGDRIVAGIAATASGSASGERLSETQREGIAGGRAYTCMARTDAEGRVVAEHWALHGAGHAWSGGDPSGSFTDAAGPDASGEMLRFFLERSRPPPHA